MILAYLRLIAHCACRLHRPELLRYSHRGEVQGVWVMCECGKLFYRWEKDGCPDCRPLVPTRAG